VNSVYGKICVRLRSGFPKGRAGGLSCGTSVLLEVLYEFFVIHPIFYNLEESGLGFGFSK
jgi:hypothetical protein